MERWEEMSDSNIEIRGQGTDQKPGEGVIGRWEDFDNPGRS